MITRKELLKNNPLIIAGPCSVSSRKQILKIAYEIKKAGAHAIRTMLWKPRTNSDSFQGIGEKGIPWIKEVKEKIGLPIVMEILESENIGKFENIADILLIGSRNMQNYDLLKRMSKDPKPVVLKRGFIANMKEWIGAADYIGRDKVILCERGIRTGADSMRFTLDLNSMLVAKHDFHMPVIIDPSHTAGRRDMVPYLAKAGIAAGADGVIIETHYNPLEELVDKDQTITIEVFYKLIKEIKNINKILRD